MSSLRASGPVLVTAAALLWISTAYAQEAGDTTGTTTKTTSTTGTTTETTTTEPAPAEPTQTGTTESATAGPWAETPETRRLLRQANRFKKTARRLHHLMGKPRPRIVQRATAEFDSLLAYRQWLRRAWRGRAVRARLKVRRPPHLAAWLCIHAYEGHWRDPDSPYYGGLQMDLAFQRQYGPELLRRKGTADRWTPYEQMWVAERALRAGRGFYPWPFTARRCGLI